MTMPYYLSLTSRCMQDKAEYPDRASPETVDHRHGIREGSSCSENPSPSLHRFPDITITSPLTEPKIQ